MGSASTGQGAPSLSSDTIPPPTSLLASRSSNHTQRKGGERRRARKRVESSGQEWGIYSAVSLTGVIDENEDEDEEGEDEGLHIRREVESSVGEDGAGRRRKGLSKVKGGILSQRGDEGQGLYLRHS